MNDSRVLVRFRCSLQDEVRHTSRDVVAKKVYFSTFALYRFREPGLAEVTGELLPEVRVGERRLFDLSLGVKPGGQAF